MYTEIPYSKAFRMALLTAPLFGLLGAAPVLGTRSSIELSKIITGFLIVTSSTLIIWGINIGLLWFFSRVNFRGKDWLRYIVSAAACILIFLVVRKLFIKPPAIPPEFANRISTNFPPPPQFRRPFRIIMPLIQVASINLVIIVLLEMLLLRGRKRRIEEENTKLRMFNLEARHSQLKEQLHPHFLFNSLSNLRSLIKRSPNEAEQYLDKLSEFLRFSINSTTQTIVSLKEEIELTRNYLDMQKVRFGNALNATVDIPAELLVSGKVPVYSVQLLAENAIKHNILTISQPLHIGIFGSTVTKIITIENNLQPKLRVEDGKGVGLSNLAERYRLLDKEEISVYKTNEKFIVNIKVLENESSDN